MNPLLISFFKYLSLVLPALWVFILSLRPVVSIDAMKLHMALPAAWKNEGFFFFREFNSIIELGMMNIDYLYMLLLKFSNWEPLPKIAHASFLILTGIFVYRFISKRYGLFYGILSYLMILTLPINQRLSSEVYVDLGLLFFSSLSVIYFLKAFEKEFRLKYFIISSIACGLVAGSKYTGLVFAFVMIMLVLHETSKNFKIKNVLLFTSLYSGAVLILISPWLIRNFVCSGGNPLYPLFSSVFSSTIQKSPSHSISGVGHGYMAWRYFKGETFLDVIFIPLRFFFSGRDHDFLRFDGVLNPFMPILVFFAFVKAQYLTKRNKFHMVTIIIFTLIFASYHSLATIRYAIAFTVPLTILSIEGIKNSFGFIKHRHLKNIIPCSLITLLLFFNLNYAVNYAKKTQILEYLKGDITKEAYLKTFVPFYDLYEYINANTPEDAVIYDVLSGNRMYYVERTYICSEWSVNRWFNEIVYRNEGIKEFYELLENLPNTNDLRADYLIIRPNLFYNSFLEIYYNHEDPEGLNNKRKLQMFIDFLSLQTPVFISGDMILYKINYGS